MIRKILVPLDGSAMAEAALPQAIAVARACQAEIVLVRVLDANGGRPGGLADSVSWRLARSEAGSYLEGVGAKLREQGVSARRSVAEGDAAEEILRLVKEQGIDLVVLCAHGHSGAHGFRLGRTSQKLLSSAGASVLLVRREEPPAEPAGEIRYQRIMVPLDGSQRAQWALMQAAPLARVHGGELLLVHVVSPPRLPGRTPPAPEEVELARRFTERDRQQADLYLRELKETVGGGGLRVRTLILESPHVVRTLLDTAAEEQASLLVISAHGCSGAAPWPFGSVADRLIQLSTVPLLVLQDLAALDTADGEEEGEPAKEAALAS